MTENKEITALKTALLLEKQGKMFYERVARDSESRAVGTLFDVLAEEETKHIEALTRQFAHFSRQGVFLEQETDNDTGSVVPQVLSAEIRTQIAAASYEAAAISAAIELENRAVRVYSERADSSRDAGEKKLYSWLAQWERGHLKFLADINDELVEEIWHESNFWPF